MARSPFSFLSEVVTRTKSSPVRANTVAMVPPVRAKNLSGTAKSRFIAVSPLLKVGVGLPATATVCAGSTLYGPGAASAKAVRKRSASVRMVPSNRAIMSRMAASWSRMADCAWSSSVRRLDCEIASAKAPNTRTRAARPATASREPRLVADWGAC